MRKFSIILLTAAAVVTLSMSANAEEPRRFLQTIEKSILQQASVAKAKDSGKGDKEGPKNGVQPSKNGTEVHNETLHNETAENHTEGGKNGKGKVILDYGSSLLADLITSYQTPSLSPVKREGKWVIGYNYTKKVKSTTANITASDALTLLQYDIGNGTKA